MSALMAVAAHYSDGLHAVRQHTARAAWLDNPGPASDPSPFETPPRRTTGATEGTTDGTWRSEDCAGPVSVPYLFPPVTSAGAVDPAALARLFRSLHRIR